MPKINKSELVRFFLCWTAALVLEYPLLAALGTQDTTYLTTHLSASIATHFMSAIALFFCQPRLKGWFHFERNWAQLFFFLTFFLPLFGPVLCGIIFVLSRNTKIQESISDNDNDSFGSSIEDQMQRLPPAIDWDSFVTASIECQPLADILASTDTALKRSAIEKLTALASPEAIAILLNHRSNTDPEVRHFVTIALDRVQKAFSDDLAAAHLEINKNDYKDSARLLLAKIYRRYANSGLLNENTALTYLKECHHHLSLVVDAGTINQSAYPLFLTVLEELSLWHEAAETVAVMQKKYLITPTAALQLKAKYFFATNRLEDLKFALKELARLGDLDATWTATINWFQIN